MIGHLTNRTLTVHRPTTTPDGSGGYTTTYADAGTVRAQVNQPGAAEQQTAQQRGVELSHVAHVVAGSDVRRGDELGGELPSEVPAGSRLRVVSTVSNSRSSYLRAECEIVQAQQ